LANEARALLDQSARRQHRERFLEIERKLIKLREKGDDDELTADVEENPSKSVDYIFPNIRHFTIGSYSEPPAGAADEDGDVPIDESAIWTQKSRPLVKLLSLLPNLLTVSLSILDSPRLPQFSSCILRSLIDAGPNSLRNLTLINFPIELQTESLAEGLLRLQLRHLTSLDLMLNPSVNSATRMLERI
jgi:hypothetical protein